MKKICLLSTNLTFEGNVVFYLARLLSENGFNVTLVAPHGKGLDRRESVDGIKIKRFHYCLPSFETLALGSGIPENLKRNPLNWLLVPWFMLALSLKAIIEARKCDVLHAHWLPAGIAALPAKYLLEKPVVLTLHGSDVRNKSPGIVGFFLRRFDAIITGHDELLAIVKKSAPKKSHLIRNAVDFSALDKILSKLAAKKRLGVGGKTVMFVGRINNIKRPLDFIKAIPIVLKKRKDVKFVLVGDGPLEEECKELARELGIEKNVIFTGRIKDTFNHLAAAEVFTALSDFENAFSVSLVEAMLASVPCVITKAGTTEKFFSHKKDCMLIPSKNPEELAKAILFLIENNAKAKQIGIVGKELAEKLGFGKESIINQTLEIYDRVLQK